MKRVLIVAYYFPPMGGTGVQRVSNFVKYLPEQGWQPTVLTVRPGGYYAFDDELLEDIRAVGAGVHRTASWDPTRLFGQEQQVQLPPERQRKLLNRLSQFFFVPDNKIGWLGPALRRGRRLLKEHHFDAILATAPPYTALLVGRFLHGLSSVPLVVDFRDDWIGNPRHVYPTPLHRWAHERMERSVLRASAAMLATNERMASAIQQRHPEQRVSCHALSHGFDPEDLSQAPAPRDTERLRLVYAGTFYDVQTPDSLLRALARLPKKRRERVEAVFVGTFPAASQQLARELDIDHRIRHVGFVSHRKAVAHLKSADVLWLTLGRGEGQETILLGKLPEYVGARKPILGLVPEGATRDALARCEAAQLVPPDDVPAITRALSRWIDAWEKKALPIPSADYVRQFDVRHIVEKLARVLDRSCRISENDGH